MERILTNSATRRLFARAEAASPKKRRREGGRPWLICACQIPLPALPLSADCTLIGENNYTREREKEGGCASEKQGEERNERSKKKPPPCLGIYPCFGKYSRASFPFPLLRRSN